MASTIATYQAGQYITLKVKPEKEEYTSLRHYSLSDASWQRLLSN